jgi:hypothetical protein
MITEQLMGLSQEALDFLDENEVLEVCPHCNQIIPHNYKIIGTYHNVLTKGGIEEVGEDHNLLRHPLKNGNFADEFVQYNPWTGPASKFHPTYFLGLKLSDGTVIQWSEEAIQAVLGMNRLFEPKR